MARKARESKSSPVDSNQPEPAPGPGSTGEGALPQATGAVSLETGVETGPAQKRLSFPLTPEGVVDLDRVRDDTKSQMRRAFSDPKVSREIFGSSTPVPAGFSDQDCEWLFNLLGEAEAFLAEKSGIPKDVAREIFLWDREEVNAIKDPSKACLNKWLPGAASVETTFLLALAGIHQKKFFSLQLYKASQKARMQPRPVEMKQ